MARLKGAVSKQTANISALAEDVAVRLSGNAGHGMEQSEDTAVISVIHIVVKGSVEKTYQCSAFHTGIEMPKWKCLPELIIMNEARTSTNAVPAFAVPVGQYVEREVNERYVEKAEVEKTTTYKKC